MNEDTGTLASLDDIDYSITLENSQVEPRKLEAHSHNLEARHLRHKSHTRHVESYLEAVPLPSMVTSTPSRARRKN